METLKKYLNRIFLDGLSGMATGLFSTLIVGTIIQQIGTLIGGNIGDLIYLIGKMAAAVTGAGIGVGVACRLKRPLWLSSPPPPQVWWAVLPDRLQPILS